MILLSFVFLFFIYKSLVMLCIKYLIFLFPLRIDLPLIYFYGFLSIFQFIFSLFLMSGYAKSKKAYYKTLSNLPFLIVFTEILILLSCGYYLFKMEQDIVRVYFIILSVFNIHSIFYLLFSIISIFMLRKLELSIRNASFFSRFIYFLISYLTAFFFLFYKIFFIKKFTQFDILASLSVILTNIIVNFIFATIRYLNYKKLSKRPLLNYPLDFEIGFLQSIYDRVIKEKKSEWGGLFYSSYISENLKSKLLKYGFSILDREYEVVILSFGYSIDDIKFKEVDKLRDFIKSVGMYAIEYDAYPLFYGNKCFLLFGFPENYSHRYLNALEVAERLIKDNSKFITDRMEFLVHAAICEEKTKVMLLPVKSKNINEIVVAGRGIELAEKITDVCKSQRANLIITSKVYENLKSRVIIDRVYKLKEENEEIKLYQVRL